MRAKPCGGQLALPGMPEAQSTAVDQWLSAPAVVGVDEVGRGALFGPVVAAAVVLPMPLPPSLAQAGITDSKQLSAPQRHQLATLIRQTAVSCQVGMATVAEIDRLNILQATFLAMRRAIARIEPPPQFCLVDGNQLIPHLPLPQASLVKGDQISIAIAAASIVAKVWRDELIVRLSDRYPGYDLARNKGYGSKAHRQAIAELGITRQHRRSFKPCQMPKSDE